MIRKDPRHAASWRTGIGLTCMLALMPGHASVTADRAPLPSIHLHVPYPVTGPREIQSSDRSTRRYRAIAARTAAPVTDAMADMIAAALWVGADLRVTRSRRDDLQALTTLETASETPSDAPVDLVLAGDDRLRAFNLQAHRGAARRIPTIVEPIADMPFVLLCKRTACLPLDRIDTQSRDRLAMKFGSIGTTGALGGSGIAARAWARYVGGNPLLVPYAGGNGTVRDLVAGRLDAAFVALPLALGYIRHEKLRALALSAKQRFERLPDVPTLVESGVPIGVEGWFAVFRSGRLPGAVAARAQAAIRAYRMEDASRSDLLSRGLVPSSSTPAQLAHRIRLELVAGLAAQPDPASRD